MSKGIRQTCLPHEYNVEYNGNGKRRKPRAPFFELRGNFPTPKCQLCRNKSGKEFLLEGSWVRVTIKAVGPFGICGQCVQKLDVILGVTEEKE
jgi:hypothetical protein